MNSFLEIYYLRNSRGDSIVDPAEFAQALAEKNNNEEDKHSYYGYSYDHEIEYTGKYGVAFYLKEKTQYVLQFFNDDFLVNSLGQRSAYNALVSEDDEVVIDIIWGNHRAGPTYSRYYFVFDELKKDWRLNRFVDLKSNVQVPEYQYKGCAFDEGVSMKVFSMETFLKEAPVIDPYTLCLHYPSDDESVSWDEVSDYGFADFYQQIKTIHGQNKGELLKKLLEGSDIAQFIFEQDYYSGSDKFYVSSDVAGMNNLAYLLEQMDCLDFSQIILESVVLEAPERTVAYINLGDVYRKQGEVDKAKQAYRTYIDLMTRGGRQARIPERVKVYVESLGE